MQPSNSMNENNLICIQCPSRTRWLSALRRCEAVQRSVFGLENEQYGPCRLSIMSRNLKVRESGKTLWPLGANPPVVITTP